MSEITNQIGEIASGMLEYEFDYITGDQARSAELLLISGTLSGKIGELNILLNQSFNFTGVNGDISPALQQEEVDILEQIYLRDYNTKQAQKLLRGLYDTNTTSSVTEDSTPWIELTEGDTTIKKSPGSSGSSASSRLNMSKDFKALSEEARKKIEQLVYMYNMYGSVPREASANECGESCGCKEIDLTGDSDTTPSSVEESSEESETGEENQGEDNTTSSAEESSQGSETSEENNATESSDSALSSEGDSANESATPESDNTGSEIINE